MGAGGGRKRGRRDAGASASWDAAPGAGGERFLRLRGEGPEGEAWGGEAGAAAERALRALRAELLETCGAVGGAVPLRRVATLGGGEGVVGVPLAWGQEVAGVAALVCRAEGAACRLRLLSHSDSLMRVLGGDVAGALWGASGEGGGGREEGGRERE